MLKKSIVSMFLISFMAFVLACDAANNPPEEKWVMEDLPIGIEDIVLDNNGDILFSGFKLVDEVMMGSVAKLNTNQEELWIAYTPMECELIAVDAENDILVAGTYDDSKTDAPHIGIGKINSNGNVVWTLENPMEAFPGEIAVDSNGSAIVAGTGNEKFQIVKYDSTGALVWSAIKDVGQLDFNTKIRKVMVDSNDDIVLATNQQSDYVIMKYSGIDGSLLWEKRINENDNYISDITLDSKGNVIITGSERKLITRHTITTFKFDSDGNQVWKYDYWPEGVAMTTSGLGQKVIVDGNDNVIVGGVTYLIYAIVPILTPFPLPKGLGNSYPQVLKISESGKRLWKGRGDATTGLGEFLGYRLATNSINGVYASISGKECYYFSEDGDRQWKVSLEDELTTWNTNLTWLLVDSDNQSMYWGYRLFSKVRFRKYGPQ
ncbi:MAG: PQQ-binding-like beta-propeller repeat protein [bacterium]|nr:PQQ-binding-like beta-propeller repeat protein [bacterium]